MKIVLEKSKYHKFALYFDYDQDMVDFCRNLKDGFGWDKFSFEQLGMLKRWIFSDPLFIEVLRKEFPAIVIGEGVWDEVIQIEGDAKKIRMQKEKLEEIKERTDTNFKVKGIKGEMYAYQKVGVEFLIEAGGRAIVADSMGLGKSLQALGYVKHMGFKRTLIVCPASVKFAWENEVKKWTNLSSIVIDSKTDLAKIDGSIKVWIINYDILKKHYAQLSKIRFDCIVGDEAQYCFPGETLVKTESGQMRIKDIVEKKLDVSVASCNSFGNDIEYKKVIGYQKNEILMPLLKIKHEYGEFTCTANHRVWTEDGYIEAGLLSEKSDSYLRILRSQIYDSNKREKYSSILFSFLCRVLFKFIATNKKGDKKEKSKKDKDKMCLVWENGNRNGSKVKERTSQKILRKIMLSKMESNSALGERKCENSNKKSAGGQDWEKMSQKFRTHEKTEQRSRIQKKSNGRGKKMEEREPNIFTSWWKWSINKTSNTFSKVNGLTNGTCNSDSSSKRKIRESSKSLFSGSSYSGEKNSHRDRWENPYNKKMEIFRQTKNESFSRSRVVSVEILEQGSLGESRKSSKKNQSVYNIEVADNNNYFADSVLVSNCKSTKALRTKAFRAISSEIGSVVLLSGTPLLSRPSELFSLLNIIDPAGWQNWYDYAKRFCDMHQTRWGMDTSGVSNAEELHSLIKRYFIRRDKTQVLTELPPKTHITLPVELDSETAKEYKTAATDLANYLRTYVGKGKKEIAKSMAAEKLTQLNVLRQLSAVGKIKVATELIQSIIDSGEKVLVFSSFVKPLEMLQEKFKKESVIITGKTTVGERGEIVDQFQNNDNIKVFFGGIKSAGIGITLTKASNVIFLDYSWCPADHQQAEDRAHRIGTKASSINIHQLHSIGTIDEDLKEMLDTKQEIFETIIEGKEDKSASKAMESAINRVLADY